MRHFSTLERHHTEKFPVLALHSSASTGGQWKNLVQGLGSQGVGGQASQDQRRIFTPDLPGYGRAGNCAALMYPAELESEARWVLRNAGLPAGPFHLVGHSYGGAVALKVALLAPQRVRSLTLIEPVLFHLLARAGESEKKLYRQILGLRDRVRGAVAAGWPAHGMTAFIDFWSGEGTWHQLDHSLRQAFAEQAKSVLRNFEATLKEGLTLDEVAALRMPLQAITGGRSPEVTRRLCELLVDNASSVTATQVFDAGHMAPVTHAASVNAAIVHHIRRAEGARTQALSLSAASPLVA